MSGTQRSLGRTLFLLRWRRLFDSFFICLYYGSFHDPVLLFSFLPGSHDPDHCHLFSFLACMGLVFSMMLSDMFSKRPYVLLKQIHSEFHVQSHIIVVEIRFCTKYVIKRMVLYSKET